MMRILLCLVLSINTYASVQNDVLTTLWHELGHPPKKIVKKENDQRNYPNTLAKKEEKKVMPIKEKELSPGQRKIEEIKARNRKLIQQRKVESHASDNIYDQYRKNLSDLKRQTTTTLASQKNMINKTRERWRAARDEFLKNLSHYKENTFSLESVGGNFQRAPLKLLSTSTPLSRGEDYYVVKNAFKVGIKDQGKRPTCSAFAGASAIEIMLRQNQSNVDVSEQYLYWSSKPYCQKSPCSKKGSWISYAYDNSINSKGFNIPSEGNCPYNSLSRPGNETQIPLSSSCQKGVVKVDSYQKISTSSKIIEALEKDRPIIIGVKLSPNFYTTSGIITYQDSLVGGKMDQHASGHALLLIGYMKLPKKLAHEGRVCYITANSWTQGWGAGGYGCLSEKWLTQYKVNNPFLALSKVRSL
ncbi:putative exported protein [Halobacteriovorax marinus SJ]|uniref:Exported protein n=1 Tax=Halobacteriovorax marinus (strain ATCC BAA-682 / DSM 15412 / SJ) TaxID=862908 RepID=E1X4X4_HALMS|nr:C1 family peptidase [Halobacteriovorax marinus]CBW27200.1 putative exported protein [Halobacteriovorax marinus SJ]